MTTPANFGGAAMGSDVVGALFTDRNAASIAIDELHYAGFGDKQVGLVVRDGSDWKISGMGQNTDAGDAPTLTSNRAGASSGDNDNNNDGDATGVPPVIIAPAPQASTGVAGSGAGGLGAGMFAAYGFDEALSGRLSGDLEKGAMLVVVKATGRSTEAKNILERNGGKMAR